MQPDFATFFENYAAAFNRSLGESVDADAIMAAFADCFVSASPSGVNCGHNGVPFRAVLQDGYAFYKQVGTERVTMRGLDVRAIDEFHHSITVHWRTDYKRADGDRVEIDFDVTYLTQTLPPQGPKIFAFISGDELTMLEAHGLLEPYQDWIAKRARA